MTRYHSSSTLTFLTNLTNLCLKQLPRRFFLCAREDFPKCDLLLVLGTSLVVHPFAGLVDLPSSGTPRLLINRERVGGRSFDYESPATADSLYLGDCDAGVTALARGAGWETELNALDGQFRCS